MNTFLRVEYAALFALSMLLFASLPYAWWWYPLLLLVPDVGMLGYLAGPKVGAMTYNALHWIGLSVALYAAGSLMGVSALQLAGVIVLGHESMDRLLGFGLKYPDSFKHTHLGNL